MINKQYSFLHTLLAWCVHIFTASAAFLGVLTLYKIFQHEYIQAFWLMGATIAIDALDGTFARLVQVKHILPKMDGALLDNIVDFVNYVITPCFFLLINPDMLPTSAAFWVILSITMTSCYQFCQADAKTPDHFFKGFPCYWNFAVFYMFIFNSSMYSNVFILILLSVLIFVPIKYVYPSRLDYLTSSRKLKLLMHGCSITFAMSSALILLTYPTPDPVWLWLSLGYVVMYLLLSFYRTYTPMRLIKVEE